MICGVGWLMCKKSKMSKKSDICLICLHTDKDLKIIHKILSDFHDEICDYSVDEHNPRYCSECEYLLKKTYKFIQRCKKAYSILKKWKKSVHVTQPISSLWTLIPEVSLSIWTPTKVLTYQFLEGETQTNKDILEPAANHTESTECENVAKVFLQKPHSRIEIKRETDKVQKKLREDDSVIPKNFISLKNEGASFEKILFKNDNLENNEKFNDVFSDYDFTDEDNDKLICIKNNLNKNKPKQKKSSDENIYELVNKDSIRRNRKKFSDENDNDENNKDCIRRYGKRSSDESDHDEIYKDSIGRNGKKSSDEIDHDEINKDSIGRNRKGSSNESDHDEINKDSIGRNRKGSSEESDHEETNKDSIGRNRKGSSEESDHEETNKDSIRRNRKRSSNESDHEETIIDNLGRNRKRSSDERDHEKINKDSLGRNRNRASDKSNCEESNSKKRNSGRKEKVYSKRSVPKKNEPKQIAKKNGTSGKTRFHTNKAIYNDLKSILSGENCETKDDKNLKLCMKRPYSKERLMEEIRSKFASCGELRATDGMVIDKEYVLQCLDDRVTEFVLRQLYSAVHNKKVIKPKALKLFKCIQNKYKVEYSSVFDIEYLNTKEKILEEFEKRKTYDTYVTAEFKCEVCFQGFRHEKKLTNHQKCHQESAGPIICGICKVRQRSKKSLISHVNNMHEAVYRCKLCPLVTYYKNSMKNHYQQHKGVKFSCTQCHSIFGSMSSFRTHMSYRHARDHVCTSCGQAYSTRTGLLGHTTKEHRNESTGPVGEASVKCDQCSLSFVTAEAYNKHNRLTHKRAVKGRPPGTTVRFRNDRPRKQAVVACRLCDSVGGSWGWLSLHFSLAHPGEELERAYADKNQHLCDKCGKTFSTIYTLQAHLNVHTGLRPFACETCGARFPRALSLRLHRLVHRPPTKPCALCGKKFRSHSNLHNHMRSHIGDRRYKCEICGKGFIHRNSLNEHVRGVHRNIRRVRKRGLADGTARGH